MEAKVDDARVFDDTPDSLAALLDSGVVTIPPEYREGVAEALRGLQTHARALRAALAS
jgi:hypothetical protein